MARRSRVQLELPIPPRWGGRRRGAGRPPTGARPGLPHDPREAHDARHPLHVTLRCFADIPSLRSRALFSRLRSAIAASNRAAFRIVHFSAQLDHLHLVIEADAEKELVGGVSGLAIRCALAVNRVTGRRGSVWADRFHARALRTPSEVRRALVYVLLNFRKHLRAAPESIPAARGRGSTGGRDHRRRRANLVPSPRRGPGCLLSAGGAQADPSTGARRRQWR